MVLKIENRRFAEKALTYLLVGSQMDGIKFESEVSAISLTFTHYDRREDDAFVLTIETAWTVYDKEPYSYPSSEEEVPSNTEEQHFKHIWDIKRQKVVNVQLSDVSPHLIISFESGNILFVNGHGSNYECWQLGDHFAGGNNEWLLVAVPGDDIAVGSPQHFQ
ncbi:hypothetical protein ABEX44_07130 [Priestia megaterium]